MVLVAEQPMEERRWDSKNVNVQDRRAQFVVEHAAVALRVHTWATALVRDRVVELEELGIRVQNTTHRVDS
jgi:hypothetical protein